MKKEFDYEAFFSQCKVTRVEDEEHWHQLRGEGLGGSDAGTIMNVNGYKKPYELWEEKTGQVARPFITNKAIEIGNAMEPVMFDMFRIYFGDVYEVIDTKDISLENISHKFLHANLDGALIEKASGRKGVLEIKTTTIQNGGMFKKWKKDMMPITYFFQCLHYLLTTGFNFVVLYGILNIPWANKQETRVVIIEKEDLIAELEWLLKTERWFWNKIVNMDPPPFSENRNLKYKEDYYND